MMRLRLEIATPPVECVIDHHAVTQHLVVIREIGGKAERNSEQTTALRREIVPRCVSPAYYDRKTLQGRVVELILRQKSIEGAQLADVAQFRAGDIVRNGPCLDRTLSDGT